MFLLYYMVQSILNTFVFVLFSGLIPKHLFYSGQINVQFVISKELNLLEQSQN